MRIGILIIGSLLWDGSPVRCQWRRDRLGCTEHAKVRVPIRYGRKSSKRGDTFTMVFARSCSSPERLGTALVVPARAECCDPTHLLEEAECLWAAEQKSPDRAGIASNWGRVCLVHQPDRPLPDHFTSLWKATIKSAGRRYRAVPAAVGEEQLIDPVSGVAQFEWPIDAESQQPLIGFDLLLMTATEPTLTESRYPSAKEIAEAWRADANGNASYFYSNLKHGITTFEDEEILRVLNGETPGTATAPETL